MSKNTVIPKAACAILLAALLLSSCGSAPAEVPSAATTEAPDQQSAANAETAASTAEAFTASGTASTAVTGVSQGGTEALASAFKWQDKIAYVGSFAPSTGVIPTPFYKGSFWNTPILDDFKIDSPETMPRYIYLCVGTEDPYCINSTLYYGEIMDKKGIPNRTELIEGYDHGNEMWELGHYNFLQKIFLD